MAKNKNTIGSRIVIEGEKEYNEALRRIKTEQQELRSEMKLCTETYRDNANATEALQKKAEILTKQVETQARAVENQKKLLEGAGKAQEDAGKKVEKYKNELEKAQKKLEQMESAADASTEAIEKQKKEVEELSGKLVLSEQGYNKAETATIKYRTSLNHSETELQKLKKELEQTNDYLGEAEEAADGCAKSIDQYGKKTKEAGEASQHFANKTTKAVEALAGVMAASGIIQSVEKITEALLDCAEAAATFETGMNKVYTIADAASVAQKDMADQLLNNAVELVQYSDKMTEAAYNALSAGVDTNKVVGFTADATKLAIGGYTASTTAVDILTTTINAYNLEIEKSKEISDMLITTQNLGKTTVDELATNMGRVIPLAAAYNTKMDNLSATYAIMTANGIKNAETTTYIKAMLNELGDSGSVVAKTLREQTGMSFAELMEQGYSLGEVIDLLGQSANGDAGAFNELWSSSEAGIGALSLLGSGAKEFNRVLEAMQNSAGATQKAFDKMTDSTEYAEERMHIAIANLQVAIGNVLNPVLKEMYEKGTDAFVWATEFVQEHPEVVEAVAVVVAALGGAAIAIGAVTAAVVALKAVLAATNPVIAGIIAAIGAVVGAVTALVAVSKEEQSELEKYIETTKEATAVQQEKIDAIQAEMDATSTRLQRTRELVNAVALLNDRENLSVQEKAELVDQIAILNELMPQLNIAIDEQTGKIDENTTAFVENAKMIIAMEEANAALQSRKEIMEERQAVEAEAAKTREAYEQATEKVLQAEKELQEFAENNGIPTTQNEARAMAGQCAEAQELRDKLEEAKEEEMALQQIQEEQEAQLTILQEEYDNLTACIEANKDASNENRLVQVEYKGTVHDVTVDVAASMRNLETAYKEAQAAAEESLKSQVGLFDELSTASDLNTEEMAKNLQSQTEAFTQYKDDLLAASDLVEKGLLDEGLLGSIQALGMDGAGYLHELISASQEDAEAYAEVVAKYQEMVEARKALSETMGDLQTDYSGQMDDYLNIQTEKYGQLVTNTEDTYADIQSAIEEALANMATAQAAGMDTMIDSVTEKYPEMETAAGGLCDAAQDGLKEALVIVDDGSSEVFRGLGNLIPESVAAGILERQDLVAEAVQKVINNAVASADMTAIANTIDRMLGDTFS